MLKSYSLKHERGDELEPLLRAYRDVVNQTLEELWSHIEWEKRKVKGRKQWRLLPKYKVNIHSKEYKNCLLYTSPSPRDRQKSRMPSSA